MTAKGASRRRFGRAGLGASGVLMTLASQPAMAQALCATASGSLSTGMQSRQGGQALPACNGDSPEQLVPADEQGKGAVKNNGMRFKNLYTTGLPALSEAKITDVLRACSNRTGLFDNSNPPVEIVDAATIQVAGHMVAAMLNFLSRKTTVNDDLKLKSIWNAYDMTMRGQNGYYSPSATVKWYHDGIVRYIKTTYKGGAVIPTVAP